MSMYDYEEDNLGDFESKITKQAHDYILLTQKLKRHIIPLENDEDSKKIMIDINQNIEFVKYYKDSEGYLIFEVSESEYIRTPDIYIDSENNQLYYKTVFDYFPIWITN